MMNEVRSVVFALMISVLLFVAWKSCNAQYPDRPIHDGTAPVSRK